MLAAAAADGISIVIAMIAVGILMHLVHGITVIITLRTDRVTGIAVGIDDVGCYLVVCVHTHPKL